MNRLPTRVVSENKTPYELFLQKKPSVALIQIFGCQTYIHIPDEKRSKLVINRPPEPKIVRLKGWEERELFSDGLDEGC